MPGQGEGGNEDDIDLNCVICSGIMICQSDGGGTHAPETLGIYGQVQIAGAAARFHFDKGNFLPRRAMISTSPARTRMRRSKMRQPCRISQIAAMCSPQCPRFSAACRLTCPEAPARGRKGFCGLRRTAAQQGPLLAQATHF